MRHAEWFHLYQFDEKTTWWELASVFDTESDVVLNFQGPGYCISSFEVSEIQDTHGWQRGDTLTLHVLRRSSLKFPIDQGMFFKDLLGSTANRELKPQLDIDIYFRMRERSNAIELAPVGTARKRDEAIQRASSRQLCCMALRIATFLIWLSLLITVCVMW
jgi:hypothetical protein